MFLSIITRVYYLDIYPFTKFFVESPSNVSRIEAKIKDGECVELLGKRKKKEKSMRRVTETTPSGKLQGDLFRGGSRS